ncbi:MAG: hypothetical protein ACYCQJ_12505 [Nitrososphaerales archaeon]
MLPTRLADQIMNRYLDTLPLPAVSRLSFPSAKSYLQERTETVDEESSVWSDTPQKILDAVYGRWDLYLDFTRTMKFLGWGLESKIIKGEYDGPLTLFLLGDLKGQTVHHVYQLNFQQGKLQGSGTLSIYVNEKFTTKVPFQHDRGTLLHIQYPGYKIYYPPHSKLRSYKKAVAFLERSVDVNMGIFSHHTTHRYIFEKPNLLRQTGYEKTQKINKIDTLPPDLRYALKN